MTKQTTKKKIRKAVEKILYEWGIGSDGHDIPALAVEIADAVKEVLENKNGTNKQA